MYIKTKSKTMLVQGDPQVFSGDSHF